MALGEICFLFCDRILQCFLGWNEMSSSHSSIGKFIYECCFPFYGTYIKPAHLLPGKSSWIIISHFSNSQTLLLQTDPRSWPDYAVCLFMNNIYFFFVQQPLHLCAFHCLKGPHPSRWHAASSPQAETDISRSPTEFRAAGEDLSKLCSNIKIN